MKPPTLRSSSLASERDTAVSNEVLRDLINGVSDLVQSIYPDGRIRFVNDSWLKRLGYTQDEAASMNIFEVIHPDSHEHCMSFMQRLMAGEDVGEVEVIFRTKSGESVHLEGRATVSFENGLPVATRGVFREAISPKRLERSMERLREQRRLFHSVLSMLRANDTKGRADFLDLVTRKAAQALGVSRVSVWLFDDAREHIVCECLHDSGRCLGRTAQTLSRSDHPAYFEAIESKLPVRADDARTHLATHSFSKTYLQPLGIASMLDSPIRLGEQFEGVLCCEHTGEARHWTNDEEEFTLAVAAIVLIFLETERRLAADRRLHELNAQLEELVEARTEDLAASKRRLQFLITSTPAVIYTCETSGDFRTTFISPNVEAQFGYTANDFTSRASFWIERVHPEDAAAALAAMETAVREGSVDCEYRFLNGDGTFRWVRDALVLNRDESGRPLELIGSWLDINARRLAEQSAEAAAADLRRLIETANAPIFGKDRDHNINEWNRCAERLTGYSRHEVIGRRLTAFVEPEHRDRVRRVLDLALQGVETANFEFPMVAKDGRHLLLLLNASTRRDASGAIVGMVGVGQDITEHREAERRSLRAQRLESIGTLAGGVAHDINNALSPILLATGLFRTRHPDSKDLIDVMESSARRGASMVQQLLTFAKGVDGQRVAVRTKPLFKELEQIVSSTFPKDIDARFACADDIPEVSGDSTQLHQVLLNLCVNARDAMPDGGRLTVEATRRFISPIEAHAFGEDCVPGEFVQWRIGDTGLGIPKELVERIFEPFYSTKSPEKGTGLGLSTTLGIVRSHGGFMRVQSRLGEGSVFSVFLPVAGKHREDAPPAVPAADLRAHGETVLVVDDEPAVREILRQILTSLGLQVRVANDGRAALDQIMTASVPFAAIITDLHMPIMDGIALARDVRRLFPRIPLILSSGRVDKAQAAAIEEIGFMAMLDKPFTLESLSNALGPVLASAGSGAALTPTGAAPPARSRP